MIRETFVFIYLMSFKMFFSLCKVFPLKDKTTFISYLGYDTIGPLEALENVSDGEIVIVKSKYCRVEFKEIGNRRVVNLKTFNLFHLLEVVYHLATSKKVFIDNYYAFLAVTNFKKNVTCVQLWHASGAIKKFGLKDASITGRDKRAVQRFKAVYNRFDKIVVGSDKMIEIFKQSFGITEDERFLRTGLPRTDYMFEEKKIEKVRKKLKERYPLINGRKVILYAPTYRENKSERQQFPINIELLYEKLRNEYIILYKEHPTVKSKVDPKYSDFFLNLSSYGNIGDLLLVTDILISDYSSVPFEFAFLEKPMIFYSYDLNEYIKERGIWEDYHKMVPGPVVTTTEEIVDLILADDFDIERIKKFKNMWNHYSNGSSSEKLIHKLYQK